MHFQQKVVQLSPSYITNLYDMILNIKDEDIKSVHSQKWKVHTSTPPIHILSAQ